MTGPARRLPARVIGDDARLVRDGLPVTADPVEGDGMIVAVSTVPTDDSREQLVVDEP